MILTIFQTHIQNKFNFTKCIATGNTINSENCLRLVIPSWIQEKYKLAERQLTFQTRDTMLYKHLMMPVSPEAAFQGFDYLERVMADLLPLGFDGLSWIKEEQLYHFLLRIFWGVAYNEGYVACQKNKFSATWLEGETGIRLELLHHLFRGIAEPVVTEDFKPYSIFIYKMHSYDEPSANFDLKINLNTLCIAMRIGNIGLMASLLDNGTQRQFYGDYFDKFKANLLHPIQFDELFARLGYKTFLMNNIYEYGVGLPDAENANTLISIRIPNDKKDVPIYKPWVDEVYASLVSQYWITYGVPLEDIYAEGKGVITFLETENQTLICLDAMGQEL